MLGPIQSWNSCRSRLGVHSRSPPALPFLPMVAVRALWQLRVPPWFWLSSLEPLSWRIREGRGTLRIWQL